MSKVRLGILSLLAASALDECRTFDFVPRIPPNVPPVGRRVMVRAADASERKRDAQARQKRARKITRRTQK